MFFEDSDLLQFYINSHDAITDRVISVIKKTED